MTDIPLKCSCGKVRGTAKNITHNNGLRVVCCCDDCQKFAQFLERSDEILDEFGGTDISQTSQAQIVIEHGAEHLRSVKLKPKGLVRWYTDCCKTPVGNTINGSMPFIGVIHNFMDDEGARDANLGPVKAYVMSKHALKPPEHPTSAEKFPLGVTFSVIRKMLAWKLRGMHKPSSFFTDEGKPVSRPTTLGS